MSDIAEVHWPHTCKSILKPTVCTLISAFVLCNGSQIVQGKVNIWRYNTHTHPRWWMKSSTDSWLIPECLFSLLNSYYTIVIVFVLIYFILSFFFWLHEFTKDKQNALSDQWPINNFDWKTESCPTNVAQCLRWRQDP